MKPVPIFTDLTRLTKALRVMQVVAIAFSLELLLGSIRSLWIIAHPDLIPNTKEDIWQNIFAVASTIMGLANIVVLMVWIYKAYKNALALQANLPTTPGWAVGYFFIPYLSLYRPYQIVRDLWKASGSPLGWREQKGTLLILAWWSFRIISGLMSFATTSARPDETEQALEPYRIFYAMDVFMQLTDMVYCGLEAVLVGRIWSRMKAHAPESLSRTA